VSAFEISWSHNLGYRVSVPNLLEEGDRLRVIPVSEHEAEVTRLRAELAFMADPANWLGDPYDQTSTLHGHFTPYEIAVHALAFPESEEGPA
jgi:hypothetical protein